MKIMYILLYLFFINILGYLLIFIDKRRAENGKYRISERNFFYLAFCGAEIGIILGMKKYRHKTIKKSFKIKLIMSILLQITLISCIIILCNSYII